MKKLDTIARSTALALSAALIGVAVAGTVPAEARQDREGSAVEETKRGKGGEFRRQHRARMIDRMFERYDLDGDGTITRAEVEQVTAERFARFDESGDGYIDLDAFLALQAERQRERHVAMFERMDKDGDGRLSLEEYSTPAVRMVERLEKSGDGTIDRESLRQRWRSR